MVKRKELQTLVIHKDSKLTGIVAGIQSNPDCYLIRLDAETRKLPARYVFWELSDTHKRPQKKAA